MITSIVFMPSEQVPKPTDLEKVLALGTIRAGSNPSLTSGGAACVPSTSPLLLCADHIALRCSGLTTGGRFCLPSSGDESLEGGSVVHIQLISLSELRLED